MYICINVYIYIYIYMCVCVYIYEIHLAIERRDGNVEEDHGVALIRHILEPGWRPPLRVPLHFPKQFLRSMFDTEISYGIVALTRPPNQIDSAASASHTAPFSRTISAEAPPRVRTSIYSTNLSIYTTSLCRMPFYND